MQQISPTTFPSSKRLDQRGVRAILLKGRRNQGQYFELRQLAKASGEDSLGARLAISVPKRLLQLAVQRNDVKRLVRETFRVDRVSRLPLDLLVVYRSKVPPQSASVKNTLRADLGSLFEKVAARNSAGRLNLNST
ncbi:MAG: ribonuclease P protein component [Betaproteobacteria bacterium]|nr:ribonuclease P protein component [Betaproteobacteria bacterium]